MEQSSAKTVKPAPPKAKSRSRFRTVWLVLGWVVIAVGLREMWNSVGKVGKIAAASIVLLFVLAARLAMIPGRTRLNINRALASRLPALFVYGSGLTYRNYWREESSAKWEEIEKIEFACEENIADFGPYLEKYWTIRRRDGTKLEVPHTWIASPQATFAVMRSHLAGFSENEAMRAAAADKEGRCVCFERSKAGEE
jgi:hypothetical protein